MGLPLSQNEVSIRLSPCPFSPLFAAPSPRPFNSVPDEVLMLIFEALGAISASPPPFPLLEVCRRWRSVALAIPRLWAAITLHGADQLCRPALCRMLELSADVPLYLDLDTAGQMMYPATECPPPLMRDVLALIRHHMPRVARLHLRLKPWQAVEMNRVWRAGPAPALEELVLMHCGVFQPDLLIAPALSRLAINCMPVARFRFDDFPLLVELKLKGLRVFLADLYNILESAPRLATLHLLDLRFSGTTLHAAEDWPHAALRELVIRDPLAESPVLSAFLLKLDLAALARVEVTTYSELWGEAAALCTVLSPRALRVTRNMNKIWRAELGGAQRVFTFPQSIAGSVLGELLAGVAQHVEHIDADLAFCEQVVRRAASGALPPFPRLESFAAVPDHQGRLPQNAAHVEAEMRRERLGGMSIYPI